MIEILSRLSASNIVVAALLLIIIVLIGLLYFAPALEASFGRNFSDQDLRIRMLRQLQYLRASERGLLNAVSQKLFCDGRPGSPIVTSGDFFLFGRFVLTMSFGLIGLIMAVLFGSPIYLLLIVIGYLLPAIAADLYNRQRKKRVRLELAPALQRIETYIAAGSDIRESLAKVGAKRTGPLYNELTWAARQMMIPSTDTLEILRALDVRNDIEPPLFSRIADQIERARRRSEREAREALLAEIDKYLAGEDAKRQAKIAGIANKVTAGMVPFLIIGLALSMGGPFIVQILSGN